MKKVLFLIHDLCQGGAEKVLVNLVNNMDREQFDITVMTLFDVGINKQFLKKDIKYKSCFKHPIPGNSYLMKFLTPKQLYNWLIKDDYDIVVSYLEGPSARIAAGAPKSTKVVSWIHCTINNETMLAASFRSLAEAKKCYQRADKMVFVSKSVMDAFQKVCKTNSNAVLYNVNESDTIVKQAHEHAEGFPQSCFNLCSIGKLVPLKGFDRMLKIHNRLLTNGYKTHLHIVGIGPENEALEKYCEINGISEAVTFWGYQTNPYRIAAKCDLYVCASHSEGFSTAATEALIVGTPICTVEVSGMKEMLGENDEYGIVTANDEDSLYTAIKRLLDEPILLRHYKEMAIQRGKTFSKENTVKAVENMFLDLQ